MSITVDPTAQVVVAGPIVRNRDELAAILRASGVGVLDVPAGRFAAPVAIIEPGEPFIAPATLGYGYRRIRWRVVLVVGRTDAAAAAELMAALVEAIVLTLDRVPGWSMPTVSGPRLARVVGIDQGYLAAELTAETMVNLREE